MKQKKPSRKKRIFIILLSLVACAALVMVGLMMYGKAQMGKVPGLTFREALEYTTHGKKGCRDHRRDHPGRASILDGLRGRCSGTARAAAHL